MKIRMTVILLAMSALFSCSEPDSTETFVKADQVREDGAYVFELDMTDTLCTWSLSFYSKVDCGYGKEVGDMVVNALFASPSGHVYADTLYIPSSAFRYAGSFSREVMADYRTGFKPVENGLWRMALTLPEPPDGICGMGTVLKKEPDKTQKEIEDGKR